jgi:5-methylcytosine-specific restriction endonuclease McrA
MTYRSKKLLKAANGRQCVLCGSVGTTVAAHSNSLAHGHGMGHKAPDYMTAYLCQQCHDRVDGRSGSLTRSEKREQWLLAWQRTVRIWFEEGIVK